MTSRANRRAAEAARTAESLRAAALESQQDTALRDEILSGLDEGVLLVEADGSIAYTNPRARELLGIHEGSRLPALVPDEGEGELSLHHPSKRTVRAATVRLNDGRRVVAVRDITEMRRVEAARRDFVGDASHELKTPVAAILATAETLETAAEDDPVAVRTFTKTLVREAHRLSRLVQDLLDLARLEQQEPADTPVDLSAIVTRESESAQTQASAKGLTISCTIAPDVRVRGSEADLALAARNLLDNAVRYTSAGNVAVVLAWNDGDAALTVKDSGRGIPAKDLPRIFERFYRVDEARARDTGGTGLGLAIVKHVVERHGGTVTASSALGLGSTFVLRLPRAD